MSQEFKQGDLVVVKGSKYQIVYSIAAATRTGAQLEYRTRNYKGVYRGLRSTLGLLELASKEQIEFAVKHNHQIIEGY